jgi:hypothetical protein
MTRTHPQDNYPCDCGSLERAAEDPANPIIFDSKFNEYQLEYHAGSGPAQMMIYYCPFCGGKAPGSKRNRFFARVSDEEFRHLSNMTKNIKTIEDAIKILGIPEIDSQEEIIDPEQEGKPETREAFRSLVYRNLSKTADVRITDYLRDKVRIQVEGKYTGEER